MTSHKQHTTNIRERVKEILDRVRELHNDEDYGLDELCYIFLTLLDELEILKDKCDHPYGIPEKPLVCVICGGNVAEPLSNEELIQRVVEHDTKISHIKLSLKGDSISKEEGRHE